MTKGTNQIGLDRLVRLAWLEKGERLAPAALPRDNAAAQRPIEFQRNRRIADLHQRLAGEGETRAEAAEASTRN